MRRAVVRTWLAELARPEGPRASAAARPLRLAELRRLCELAQSHGVLPAVLRNCSAAEDAFDADEPGAFNAALDPYRRRVTTQLGFSLMLRGWCAQILRSLNGLDVPHMVLKGSEFADRLYPDAALRPFTDLDLLVPRSAASSVAAAMGDLGYAAQPPQGLKHTERYGQQIWTHPDHPIAKVEIHWNLVNSPALQRRVSVQFEDLQCDGDEQTPAHPSPASLLLIAAVHGATSHAFERLQILCDVRQAGRAAAGEIDDHWLASAARRTGSGLSLATGLGLAARVFQDAACRRLAGCFARSLRTRAARAILTPAMSTDPPRLSRLRRQIFRELLKFA